MAQYSTSRGSLLNNNDVDIVTGNNCGGGAIFDLILR